MPFSSVKVLELATYIADWIDRILDTFRIRGPGRIATETWNDLKPQRYIAHPVFRLYNRTLISDIVYQGILWWKYLNGQSLGWCVQTVHKIQT